MNEKLAELSELRREDHLFPLIEITGGWGLSVQADSFGYQCSPNERLDRLGNYDRFEVKVLSPYGDRVDFESLNFSQELFQKASKEVGDTLLNVSLEEIGEIIDALRVLWVNPNAGCPRGSKLWAGKSVFHGCGEEDADSIASGGIKIEKSSGGYFGTAFYVAGEFELARSNYAEFSDEEAGAVIEFEIEDGSRILDMRNSRDVDEWMLLSSAMDPMHPRAYLEFIKRGVDGVYDRSIGGLAIYNPRCLSVAKSIVKTASIGGFSNKR